MKSFIVLTNREIQKNNITLFCKNDHIHLKCPSFLSKTPYNRFLMVKDNKLESTALLKKMKLQLELQPICSIEQVNQANDLTNVIENSFNILKNEISALKESNIELIRLVTSDEFNEANSKLIKAKKSLEVSDNIRELELAHSNEEANRNLITKKGVEVGDDNKEMNLGSNVETNSTKRVRQKAQNKNLKINESQHQIRLIEDNPSTEAENQGLRKKLSTDVNKAKNKKLSEVGNDSGKLSYRRFLYCAI
ncbi:hypothetical protein WA026_022937 [Henosepilachna vigintioctopunctata]|uniref:Uncharacterized protein n=1 Tax=Henosepilachna vigintioctopunctata TaxID=420089 RepID=A0AAW1TY47_9CUCU